MAWSHYDTETLISGLFFAGTAVLPLKGVAPRQRLIVGLIGGALVVGSLVTGTLQSFAYPAITPVLPWLAAAVFGFGVWDAFFRKSPQTPPGTHSLQQGEQGFSTRAEAPAAPVVAAPDVVRVPAVLTPEATHGFTAALAADPATTPDVLYAIAQAAPELRPDLAANPATYPDLLTWLGSLGDPAVDARLAAR